MAVPIINNLFYFTDNNAGTRQNWHFLLSAELWKRARKPGKTRNYPYLAEGHRHRQIELTIRISVHFGQMARSAIFSKSSLISFYHPSHPKRRDYRFGNFGNEAFIVTRILFTCKSTNTHRR